MAAFLCLTWAFLWVPLCPSLPFQKDPVILDGGPACERPYLQMRSHSEALGVKTSAYEFGGGHSATLNSLPPTLYWGWGGEGRRDGLCTGDKDSTVEALMCWASQTRAVWAPVILLLCWGDVIEPRASISLFSQSHSSPSTAGAVGTMDVPLGWGLGHHEGRVSQGFLSMLVP